MKQFAQWGLLIVCLTAFIKVSGQTNCDFAIEMSVEKISDCESNGIIKAVITGVNVDNKIIDTTDARYSIQSVVPGGYSTIFDANKGIIQGVPPGTYVIVADAFCSITNTRVQRTSSPITMTGTYPGFDQDQMEINTAGIINSLECSPTGVIPVRLGSGRTPYSVRIVEAPDPDLIDVVLTSPDAGILKIENVPWGKYKLALSDACGYTIYREPVVSKIEPKYRVTGIEGTPSCRNEGKIHLSLKDGTLPYTVELTSFPDEYAGENPITVEQDGNYTIDNLPAGIYGFTVSDRCHSQDFSIEIPESKPAATLSQSKASAPCKQEGEIKFNLSGGLPPYVISCIGDNCPFESVTVSAAKDTVIKGFPPGDYTFSIMDQCEKEIVKDAKIDEAEFKMFKTDVTTVSSCLVNDGTATIDVQGGASPYTVSLFNETTNSSVTPPSEEPPFNFTGLATGEYKFEITDDCGKSLSETFSITRDVLEAKIENVIFSVGCGASGAISVKIIQGTPEYTLTISQNGDIISVLGPSDETSFKFENLPPGTYNIEVKDGCNDVENFEEIVESFDFGEESDYSGTIIPADLYDDEFSSLDDRDCYKVKVNRKKGNHTTFLQFWKDNPQLFEVAFVASSDPDSPWTWIDINDTEVLSFDEKHCEAMHNNSYYTAYVRMKAGAPDLPACTDTLMDVIKFPPVKSSISLRSNDCEDDTWLIKHDNFMCAPYQIIITNTETAQSETLERSDLSDQYIKLPHGSHTIEVKTDNCTWITESVSANVPPPNTNPAPRYEGFSCNNYSMYFDFNYHCYPYEWILRETDNPDVVLGHEEINSSVDDNKQKRSQNGLEYYKEYELCILLNGTVNRCVRVYQEKRPDPVAYQLYFTPSYCLPDTGKGYIRLFRNIDFEKGAVISFEDGPVEPPIQWEYTVPQTDGIRNIYPFSDDDFYQAKLLDLKEGIYKFKIIDSCNKEYIISTDYKKSVVKDLGYDREIGCKSTKIMPKGSIYLRDEKIRSYFRIIKVPEGVAPMYDVVVEGGLFNINISGHYVLQISQQSGINSCPFDTVGFDFIKENVSLDADATLTYVCDANSDGYIRVRRKGGVGPFTYELIDKGVSIEKNNTGIFNYGRYGESYTVKITDEGCGIEFPTTVYMLDLSKTKIINDDIKLCKGTEIKLTCLSVGEYVYNWSGPNGWTSSEQNPVIPDATTDMKGRYSITVLPEGCLRDIEQHVYVDVIDPLPLPDTVIYYCINDNSVVPLSVTPEAGNYLKWYNTDTVHVSSPPVPPTDKVDTLDYFVSQVNSIYECEGEKSIVRVIIQDFPSPFVDAYADTVCKNDAPIITVPDIPDEHLDYIYRIYNLSGDLIGADTARSNTLHIQSSERMENSGNVYVEVETNHKCVSTERSTVPVKMVHPAPPVVYDTLYCLDETDVLALRADSTAGNRLQWYDIDTVTLLPSAPVPPTNVAGVFSYWVAQVDTLLGCVGDKAELKVTVSDLPGIDIDASATEICRRTSPVVIVENTNNLYTYTLFTQNNDTVDSKISYGSSLSLNSPDYILSQNEDLYVEVQNQHKCTSKDRAVVPVSVVIPDVPQVFDTLYCLNAAAAPLRATPSEGYYIQWYDINANPVTSAPFPSTDRVDILYYNVTQKHNALHCESDTVQIQVIIDALPDTVAYAYAGDICRDNAPLVIIPDTCIYPDYVYRIYNLSGDLIGADTAHSNTLQIQSSESMENSGNVYIEVETNHRCVSTERSTVPVTVIHPAPPVVYDTLYCLDETGVLALRADSTAGNRLQWYDIDTVTLLPSAPVPPTNVAGVFSYWVAQVDTLSGCVGDKAELKVTVLDLPGIDIDASATEICRRTSPAVIVENTNNLYTYTLFTQNNDTIDSKISDGSPLSLNSSDYILSQNEDLYVEVQNQHKCTSRDRAVVPVSVVIPDVPQVFDTLYCLNATAAPLRATPSEGYYIQWYDINANPVTSAPFPSTNRVDTLYYNVTQKHNVLHCESDTVPIQIIINALPDTVRASSPPVCPGQHPVIIIPHTQSDIIYNVYSESGTLLSFRQGSGDSINIVLPDPVYESENYYVETMNSNGCVSEHKTETRTEVINYMYLLPEKIPLYKRNQLYSVQLESNAVSPYKFSTDDMLPFGFALSAGGLISGTPPRNGLIEPVPFHVTVVDVNGCYAERDYVLESDMFIPQAFTPNGDGKNDIFMKGRRLVIFDRLGLKIFEGDDGWDGRRMDGTPAPPDTYFYLIYYEDENLMTQGRKEGYITLIRRR